MVIIVKIQTSVLSISPLLSCQVMSRQFNLCPTQIIICYACLSPVSWLCVVCPEIEKRQSIFMIWFVSPEFYVYNLLNMSIDFYENVLVSSLVVCLICSMCQGPNYGIQILSWLKIITALTIFTSTGPLPENISWASHSFLKEKIEIRSPTAFKLSFLYSFFHWIVPPISVSYFCDQISNLELVSYELWLLNVWATQNLPEN